MKAIAVGGPTHGHKMQLKTIMYTAMYWYLDKRKELSRNENSIHKTLQRVYSLTRKAVEPSWMYPAISVIILSVLEESGFKGEESAVPHCPSILIAFSE